MASKCVNILKMASINTSFDDAPTCKFKISINGKSYTLGREVPFSTTLLQFIRDYASLKGTKALCYEGGCGVCTVVAVTTDHEKGGQKIFSLKSCQTLVYSCAGWSIITIEHLGDRSTGYDRLQTALTGFYGTQCGYCSPGFIMTMHGQAISGKELKTEGIEKSFDGNICRCTGYRPILDAFKSFATDAPKLLANNLADIEEAYKSNCSKTGKACDGHCGNGVGGNCSKFAYNPKENLSFSSNGTTWHRPNSLQGVYNVLKSKKSGDKIRIVVGNTGQGVFKNEGPYNVYIDTSGIKELYYVGGKVSVGANVSLSRCIDIFHNAARQTKGYHHLEEVAKHWEVVANVGIRNSACWAGNLMMKHDHPGFCSDIFLTLVAVDAKLKLGHSDSMDTEISVEEFVSKDMRKSIILSMFIPPQPENVKLRTFKITPRAVNAHAYVNACFKLNLDTKDGMKILNTPCILFGGINPTFIHASKTEKFLVGKKLINYQDISKAIAILGGEIKPDSNPQDASPDYRISLSQSLFYKTIIEVLGSSSNSKIISGGLNLERPVSSGQQTYDSNEDSWPIGQAIPKLESQQQISGEAEFLDDIAALPGELFGAFVQSTVSRGKIKSICSIDCLKVPGVVDFITEKDIPGKNSFITQWGFVPDPIFTEKEVRYYGQSIGLVVAQSRNIALEAAKLVKVSYQDVLKPVLTIKESIKENRCQKAMNFMTLSDDPIVYGDVEAGFKDSKHVIEGELDLGTQFHFTMEPLAARVVPIEDGYDVFSTTQWPTETQNTVANVLGISANMINLSVKRIGGGYGGKITRENIVASAAAVAAHKLHKPVRITLDLSTHMTLVGWREPYFSKYKVGFDEKGAFTSIQADIYADAGHVPNEASVALSCRDLPNTYHCPNLKIQPYIALTDTPANTWCRTPGHIEVIATIENIIEQIAEYLDKDPLVIRETNFASKEKPQVLRDNGEENLIRTEIFPMLKTKASIEERKANIKKFNEENRWKKRGISALPLLYPYEYPPMFHYNVHVTIYEHDGTVAIQHGGIEMGQGINTKVAQVASKFLEIPIELIKVKATDVFAGANSIVTGGSFGSDLTAFGVKICCERLRERMNVVGKTLEEKGPIEWKALVKACFQKQVDLSERYFTFSKEHPKGYDIWAAGCLEVELDVLTGQFLILRADIIEDCGRSLSPFVDVGQVEGSFVMGLGFYTTEKLKVDPKTGQRLSNGTWEYKPPTALDIPIDFRISFLPNRDNPNGVVRSKASGEPAVCLSYVVVTALRQAIKSARIDAGEKGWFDLHTPLTVDKIQQMCKVDAAQFVF